MNNLKSAKGELSQKEQEQIMSLADLFEEGAQSPVEHHKFNHKEWFETKHGKELRADIVRAIDRADNIRFDLELILTQDFSRSHDAAIESEYLTRTLRGLVQQTTSITAQEYLRGAATALGINITATGNGVVKIVIPALLPGRRTKGARILIEPLAQSLKDYSRQEFERMATYRRIRRCVLVFNHIYDEVRGFKGRARDHDNVELKKIIDLLAVHFLEDDSGDMCDHHHTSSYGKEEATHIFIIPQENFGEWYMEHIHSTQTTHNTTK